jgi:hypothetical protein
MKRLVEVRSYQLRAGTLDAFHRLVHEQAVPMVRAYGMDVVGYGRSLDEPDRYFLIRAFDSVLHRQESEDEFYGSEQWLTGPRAAILEPIEQYLDAVFWMDDVAVESLRVTLAD